MKEERELQTRMGGRESGGARRYQGERRERFWVGGREGGEREEEVRDAGRVGERNVRRG